MPRAAPEPSAYTPSEDPRLNVGRKTIYATGDFTVNTVLTSLTFFYVIYFLTQVAGLRPELAAAVQFIGRAVDAVTDPAMGLHFFSPSTGDPRIPLQVWSQGEALQNSSWFPCIDSLVPRAC